jgi:hypothetical protein
VIKNFAAMTRFPTGVGPRAPKKPVIEIAPAPVVEIAKVLLVEDIPFEVPRGTPRSVEPPQDGEDPGYTPEPDENPDPPVRTKPLSAPERPKPTFMGNRPAATAVVPQRASPPPIRPTLTPTGAPPVRRAGFLPRKAATPDGTAPAADVEKPARTGFAGLPKNMPLAKAAPVPERAEPELDFVRFPTNGRTLVPDDIPF